jgi:hypothetical protein
LLKKCTSEIEMVSNNGLQGRKKLVTDLGLPADNTTESTLPQLSNTPVILVILRVSNGNTSCMSHEQCQALNIRMKYGKKLINLISRMVP